jgi:hypothetical protein
MILPEIFFKMNKREGKRDDTHIFYNNIMRVNIKLVFIADFCNFAFFDDD